MLQTGHIRSRTPNKAKRLLQGKKKTKNKRQPKRSRPYWPWQKKIMNIRHYDFSFINTLTNNSTYKIPLKHVNKLIYPI